MKLRALIFATVSAAACIPASSAMALDQTVTGTAASSIALSVPTPAAFATSFTPGSTSASTGGTVTAVSTSPSWTLAAKDGAPGATTAGKMDAATPGVGTCANSANELGNALSLGVAPVVANGAITGTAGSPVTLSGSDQTVASASAVTLAATVFNTNFSQTIGAAELLQSGCLYTLTTTYTLS